MQCILFFLSFSANSIFFAKKIRKISENALFFLDNFFYCAIIINGDKLVTAEPICIVFDYKLEIE